MAEVTQWIFEQETTEIYDKAFYMKQSELLPANIRALVAVENDGIYFPDG